MNDAPLPPAPADQAVRRVGVLLAGGSGSRFHGPSHKLLTDFRGRPLIGWALDAIRGAGLEPWVVWGSLSGTEIDLGSDVTVLHNADWDRGMATTLATAVAHARHGALDAITVGPADQPFVPAAAWRLVACADPAEMIAVATYEGVPANPVRLPRRTWHLLPTTGDRGARDLIRSRKDLVIEVACPGSPADIDTIEDYTRWNSSTTSP